MALQESLFSLQRVYLLLIVPFLQDPVQLWQGGKQAGDCISKIYTGEYPSVWINKGTDSQAAGPDKKKEIGFFLALPLAVCSRLVAFSGFRAKQTDAARRRKRNDLKLQRKIKKKRGKSKHADFGGKSNIACCSDQCWCDSLSPCPNLAIPAGPGMRGISMMNQLDGNIWLQG